MNVSLEQILGLLVIKDMRIMELETQAKQLSDKLTTLTVEHDSLIALTTKPPETAGR